jgi:hypothetical protein
MICERCNKEVEKLRNGKFCIPCYKYIWAKEQKNLYPEKYKERFERLNKQRKEKKSEWYYKDKEKNREKYKERWDSQNLRKRKDPRNLISERISSRIRTTMVKKKNRVHWEKIVGYKKEDLYKILQERLPKNVLFEECANSSWHLDHIIPVSAYNFSSYEDEDFLKCWNFRNLRLIPASENIEKKDKLDKKLIEEYNIEDLLPGGIKIDDL